MDFEVLLAHHLNIIVQPTLSPTVTLFSSLRFVPGLLYSVIVFFLQQQLHGLYLKTDNLFIIGDICGRSFAPAVLASSCIELSESDGRYRDVVEAEEFALPADLEQPPLEGMGKSMKKASLHCGLCFEVGVYHRGKVQIGATPQVRGRPLRRPRTPGTETRHTSPPL